MAEQVFDKVKTSLPYFSWWQVHDDLGTLRPSRLSPALSTSARQYHFSDADFYYHRFASIVVENHPPWKAVLAGCLAASYMGIYTPHHLLH